MVVVLAFDTATSACSAAVWRDGRVLAGEQEVRERGHAERLLPMIEGVLAEAGCAYGDLDLLAVTVGPGAFTGIRIGLAAARSLALASGLPLLGVSSFDAVAHGVDEQERAGRRVLVALETKRADIYGQFYGPDLGPTGDAFAALPEALPEARPERLGGGPLLVAGDAAERVMPALKAFDGNVCLSTANVFPDPAVVAAIAAADWRRGKIAEKDLTYPEPVYLRPPDVNLPDQS